MRHPSQIENLWQVTAPEPPETTVLEGQKTVDVAVIGGGYTGLSAALTLAEEDCCVALIEADTLGAGGSGRNVGLVNAGLWTPPEDVEAALGVTIGSALNRFLGAAPQRVFERIEQYQIACEATRQGTLHCADSASGLRSLEMRQAQWGERGAELLLLDKDEATDALGTDCFQGALLDKRAGTVQPLAYAYGLAQAAVSQGAAIFTHSPVIKLQRQSSRWHMTTPNGSIIADKVIQATNAYGQDGLKGQQPWMVPMYYFQFATPPLPPTLAETILPQEHGAWDTFQVLTSFRKDQQGRLLVGSVGNLGKGGLAFHQQWAQRKMLRLYPQLEGVTFQRGWHGRIALTSDNMPRLSISEDGMMSVYGYNGRGIGPGTVFGELLARYALYGHEVALPLAITQGQSIPFAKVQGLAIECGARAWHTVAARL